MPEYHFDTPGPLDLRVELGKGRVDVAATDTTESRVVVEGELAEDVRVEHRDGQLVVVAPPQRGVFSDGKRLDLTITVPAGSALTSKLGSADLDAAGRYGDLVVRTGSGDARVEEVDGDVLAESGSGDLDLGYARGDLRAKSGSGDVRVGAVEGDAVVSTGSGDVRVDTSTASLAVKTGSGSLQVGDAGTDLTFSTGSGDLVVDQVSRGRVALKGASGDARIGVPPGVPVWTDISTVSGRLHSTLDGAGEPQPGETHVELRIKTVSGDVSLVQL